MLAFTFEYDQPSKGAEFQRHCFEWYKDGCDPKYIPVELYNEGDSDNPGLCPELYPGPNSQVICKQICDNECIASRVGGE